MPESGIRSVWELLQYYPRDYQNFEAGDWRPDAHVMAAGVVHASKVGRHVHRCVKNRKEQSVWVAELFIFITCQRTPR